MPPLERMHEDVADRFQHEPDRKTVIELMPDKFFPVITGMPAFTPWPAGPLIVEVPREGPPEKHSPLRWLKVLRHSTPTPSP